MHDIVLVVDDMEINRDILTEILSEEYHVETAADGRGALEMIEKLQGGWRSCCWISSCLTWMALRCWM